jgi:S-adenosylmethionine-dependent methyltransferase
MPKAPEQSFDGAAEMFNEHAKTLRGYVRYQVVETNLQPYLAKPPMRVLDVGGGSGIDAAWLAVQGHDVTLLEASEVQCTAAEVRFNFFLTESERQRIAIIPGTFSNLPKVSIEFDLVLMHGVAMYQDDPATFIKNAIGYVAQGGIFSLVEKGYYGAHARAIRRGEQQQLVEGTYSRVRQNNLGLFTNIFKPEELETLLTDAGVTLLDWSGVRVITDEMFENVADIDPHDLATIIEAEYEQGHHPGIRAQGQMLHFIGRKR